MHLLAAFWFTPSIGMLNLTAESENADVLPRIIRTINGWGCHFQNERRKSP